MDEEINLSLDEIIRKRRESTRPPPSSDGPVERGAKHSSPKRTSPKPVVDARMKIINNKRAKIRDARDHLIAHNRDRDARLRLLNRPRPMDSPSSHSLAPTSPNGRGGSAGSAELMQLKRSRRYSVAEPIPPTFNLSFVNYRPIPSGIVIRNNPDADVKFPRTDVLATTTRTLHNDGFAVPSTMPPLPHFRTVRATSTATSSNNGSVMLNFNPPTISTDSDPFDQYEVNHRPNVNDPPSPLPGKNKPLRSILRTRPTTPPPPSMSGAPGVPLNLSPSMRARLERAPNPKKSMGIFAHSSGEEEPPIKNFRTRSPSPPPLVSSTVGYRIVVSNLHPSVTQIDIKELFEDIGDLFESRLVRPGVAEVIYRNLKDAEKAVDAYHNRQLDGQPMNCLLVNPRASYKLNATNIQYGR